jgi:hypothetical protein
MTNAAPRIIRLFERLQLGSFAMSLVSRFIAETPIAGWIAEIIGLGFALGLTLLVSRRRRNWARWVMLVVFVVGAASMTFEIPILLASGIPGALALGIALVQAFALALLFAPEASNWLRSKETLEETFQ